MVAIYPQPAPVLCMSRGISNGPVRRLRGRATVRGIITRGRRSDEGIGEVFMESWPPRAPGMLPLKRMITRGRRSDEGFGEVLSPRARARCRSRDDHARAAK